MCSKNTHESPHIHSFKSCFCATLRQYYLWREHGITLPVYILAFWKLTSTRIRHGLWTKQPPKSTYNHSNISRYTWRCLVCSHQAGKYTNNIFNHPTLEILYVCVFTSACLGSVLLTSLYSIWKLNDFGGLCSDTRIYLLWPQTRMRWSIPVQRYCEYFPLKMIRLWI